MSLVEEMVAEIHQKHQSILNHRWGWNDIMLLKGNGKWQLKTYKVLKTSSRFSLKY